MKPFPWRAGMLDLHGHRILAVGPDGTPSVWAVERYGEPRIIHYHPFMGDLWKHCRPDPDDGPTKGAFLEAVREKFGLPDLCILRDRSGRWYPFDMGADAPIHGHEFLKGVGGSSEWSALEAAWKAAP